MRRVLPIVLLTSCGLLNQPREKPWYAQLFFVAAADVEYDQDGLLHVLYMDAGALYVATLDADATDRALDGVTALTVDGAPVDTLAGNGGTWSDWFNLAVHPQTGTVWLFHRGRVGPIGPNGVFDPQLDLTPGDSTGARGTLEFIDDGTLFVSYERVDGGDEASFTFAVDGDQADPESAETFSVRSEGVEQALWGICDAEVARGTLYATQCGGFSWVIDLASGDILVASVDAEPSGVSLVSVASMNYVGVSEYGAVVTDQAGGKFCALPFESPELVRAAGRFANEGYCQGADALLPNPNRIDLNDRGDAWAAVYANAGIALFEERAPKDANSDLVGTWCSTVSVDGVAASFTLAEDGALVLSTQGSEILHGTLEWTRSADKLSFHYLGPSLYETSDEHFTHWAVRVGDTLHIKSTVDANSTEHAADAGYTMFSGLWTFCG